MEQEIEDDAPVANLREIIEQAASDIDTYKHHEPARARKWINDLLSAGKLGGIGGDRIEYIRVGSEVEIGTSYSVRSCHQEGRYSFPAHVLDADDPLDAISAWAWGERVAEATAKVKSARIALERAEANLVQQQATA